MRRQKRAQAAAGKSRSDSERFKNCPVRSIRSLSRRQRKRLQISVPAVPIAPRSNGTRLGSERSPSWGCRRCPMPEAEVAARATSASFRFHANAEASGAALAADEEGASICAQQPTGGAVRWLIPSASSNSMSRRSTRPGRRSMERRRRLRRTERVDPRPRASFGLPRCVLGRVPGRAP
jgi:hypothetical protein